MRSANRVLLLALAGLAALAIFAPSAAAQCWPMCETAGSAPVEQADGFWHWFPFFD